MEVQASMYKNIQEQTALKLKELVNYQDGQIVSKTLVQNDAVSMTIFSFDKGEEISTRAAKLTNHHTKNGRIETWKL